MENESAKLQHESQIEHIGPRRSFYCLCDLQWRVYSGCSMNTWKWRKKLKNLVLGHSLAI